MKRYTWLIFLLLLLFAGDRLGGWFLQRQTGQSQFRYSRLYQDAAACDILLLGNSRGLSFYQPSIEERTGRSTFNLSYNGLSIDLARVLTLDYLDRYPAPAVMLIDITLCDRFNPQLAAGFLPYVAYSSRLDSLVRAVAPKNHAAGRLSHLYRFNSEIFQRALYYRNRSDEDWLLDRKLSAGLLHKLDADYTYELKFSQKAVDMLADLVAKVSTAGTRVELVINPYYPAFAERIIDLDDLRKSVEEATGLPVRDYSQAVTGMEYFGDLQHLNKEGSGVYVELLTEEGVW